MISMLRHFAALVAMYSVVGILDVSSVNSVRAQDTPTNSSSDTITFSVHNYIHSQQWPIRIKKVLIGNKEIQLNTPYPCQLSMSEVRSGYLSEQCSLQS